MFYQPLFISYDYNPEIFGTYSQFAKRDVFYDRIVLAIAGLTLERLKRRCPIIGITILRPIVCWPDTHVYRSVDPSQPGASFVLPAKFYNRQKAASGRRASAFV